MFGLAPAPAVLIAARVAQGGCGALLIPQGIAIMTKTFPKDMLARAFAAFGPMLGLAAAGGPVLAGFIIDANIAGLSWRPVFLINIVLGGAGLVAAARLLPRVEPDPAARVDLTGSVLLGAAVFSLLYALVQGSSNGWSAVPLVFLGAAAACFAGFGRRQVTAIEQIAAGVGSAAVTAVYFSTLHSGQVHAVVVSLAVVAAVTILSLGAYRLLPRTAAPQEH